MRRLRRPQRDRARQSRASMDWDMRFILSALMGLVMLALAGAGVLVYFVDFYSQDLPDYSGLASYEPPVTTRVQAGDGRLMAEFAAERRVFVPMDAMPKRVAQAFIAAEDKNFYEHRGVDPVGVIRAVLTNLENLGSNRRMVGASTITQQVAKNMLLSNEQSFTRKVKEAILAMRIERALPKDRILELYLNEIFLGYRSYGVAAAALNYFNKSLDELTIAECAFLGALPKAPSNYNPEKKHDAAIARRNWVISRMQEDGYITADEAKAAQAEPLAIRQRTDSETVTAEYFSEEVRREIVKLYGERALYEGGLSVRATMDPTLQSYATRALRNGLAAYDRRHGWRGPLAKMDGFDNWAKKLAAVPMPGSPDSWRLAVVLKEDDPQGTDIGLADGSRGRIPLAELKWARASKDNGEKLGPEIRKPVDALKLGDVILVEAIAKDDKGKDYPAGTFALRQVPAVQGGMVVLDPHTGRVLAMAGGFAPTASGFNRAVQAMRQPGSSFKPFVYLTALENGFTPSSLILDGPFEYDPGYGQPIWRPSNYGGGSGGGPTTLRQGIEKSRNLMTVRLAQAIGMDKVKVTAETFGVVDDLKPYLPMALGAAETTTLRMATAYGMLANGGKRIIPTFIDRIQDRTGKTIFRHDPRPCGDCANLSWAPGAAVPAVPENREQIADARNVYQIVSIMEGVVQRGTAAKLASLGKTLAGKTGTTNDSLDAWFVGFSPDLAVATYVGYDQPRTLGDSETGGGVSVPIAKEFLEAALKDQPSKPFRIPPGLSRVRVNATTGELAEPGDKKAIWESFIPGTEPQYGVPQPVLDGSGQTGGLGAWSEAVLPGAEYGVIDPATGLPATPSSGGGGAPILGNTGPATPGLPMPRATAPATEGTGGIY
jgi:penicillin-binding protein 1A